MNALTLFVTCYLNNINKLYYYSNYIYMHTHTHIYPYTLTTKKKLVTGNKCDI